MSRTLASRKQDNKIIQKIAELEQTISELRGNQVQKIVFVDITLDGTGSKGVQTIGSGTGAVYLKSRVAGGIDFFRASDNTKIMSLDTAGNIKILGSITQNTTP